MPPKSSSQPSTPSPTTTSTTTHPTHPPTPSRPNNTHRQQTPSHPKLARFRAQSKRIAEQQHDLLSATKPRNPPRPGKLITKRQISNKRSAEICRAANTIYIKLLEDQILQEEQNQIDYMNQVLVQTEANALLRHDISQLQNKLTHLSGATSWLSSTEQQQSTTITFPPTSPQQQQQSQPRADFFLGLSHNETYRQKLSTLEEDEEEEEWFLDSSVDAANVQFDHIMDFQSACCTETNSMSTEYNVHTASCSTKEQQTSPVAIFDTAPYVPEATFLAPAVRTSAATF